MASTRGSSFTVDTRPTKIALVNSLTRDISIEACVFDLIDNAIDAAREALLQDPQGQAVEALPSSYADYKIRLEFSGEKFRIADNCGGISVAGMQKTALRFGERSDHPLGIGIFGLGLNRALFKLGRRSKIQTDTGMQRSELILDTEAYLEAESWDLPATSHRTTGKAGTSIEIEDLPDETAQLFADTTWVDAFRDQISKRYGRFIRKGLMIKVNDDLAVDGEVEIRKDGPIKEDRKFYSIDGVAIHFHVGQHVEHRFSAEPDYEKSNNALLTEEYGWTVLCNDRAVVMSDRSVKTGWDTKFHTEFYGFVGVINFVSSTPSNLPWDTTKSDIDLNNRIYQVALIDMRKFAQKWRKLANQAKTYKRKGIPLLPSPSPSPGSEPAPVPAPTDGTVTKKTPPSPPGPNPTPIDRARDKTGRDNPKITVKLNHNQFPSLLPADVEERYCDDKHLALVQEAKALSLHDFPYSGMALIRILFEVSAVKFFERNGLLGKVKEFILQEREKKSARAAGKNAEQQKNPEVQEKRSQARDHVSVTGTLDEHVAFMEQNPAIWGDIKAGHLQHAVRAFANRKRLLNSVIHNPYQAINNSEAFTIRDEVLPILRHLIESPPTEIALTCSEADPSRTSGKKR